MDKQRLTIERELRSNSANIIWQLISTEGGLGKWIADEVRESADGDFEFRWGELWSHHEIRHARVLNKVKNLLIRFQWVDETNPDAYWELRMEHSDMTNDYMLRVTDYALPEEINSLRDIWEQNFEQLHRSSGL